MLGLRELPKRLAGLSVVGMKAAVLALWAGRLALAANSPRRELTEVVLDLVEPKSSSGTGLRDLDTPPVCCLLLAVRDEVRGLAVVPRAVPLCLPELRVDDEGRLVTTTGSSA